VADHVSIMRRFAAKLTLQCHCSSCLRYILAWIFYSECRKNQAPYSSRPSTSLKAQVDVSVIRPLFFRTVARSAVRTSNSPNPTEPTGVARKNARVWPAVPLAIFFPPSILRLARANFCRRGIIHERTAKPSISRLRAHAWTANRLASRTGNSDSLSLARIVPRTARDSFYLSRFSSRPLP
jgi:hypothetical protein